MIKEEQFQHSYQPIFNMNKLEPIGYEALFRSSAFPNPELAFKSAQRNNKLYELDTQSIDKAIGTFAISHLNTNGCLLFINVLPSTLMNANFISFITNVMSHHPIHPSQIVLEISESECVGTLEEFTQVAFDLREIGFLVALDDVGKGYANFNMMIHVDLDFIKLDRIFTEKLFQSKQKQTLIRFFKSYCDTNSINLILEGIETKCEFESAYRLGVSTAQGYYLGRPNSIQYCQ